jgi:hypothetical protein
MSELIAFIQQVGFPIAVAAWLLWQQLDLKKVIKANTEILQKVCDILKLPVPPEQ